MKRSNSRRRVMSFFMAIAALFMAATAMNAQIYPPQPCNTYWIDTWQIPFPVDVSVNWTFPGFPPPPPSGYQTQNNNGLPGTGSFGPYTLVPAPPTPPPAVGLPQSWTVVINGVTYGPFNFPNEDWICDPFHPGKCMVFRSYYDNRPPMGCWQEFQIMSDLTCPPGKKCP